MKTSIKVPPLPVLARWIKAINADYRVAFTKELEAFVKPYGAFYAAVANNRKGPEAIWLNRAVVMAKGEI